MTRTLCAWCLKERGQVPREQDSHTICRKHAAAMRKEQKARRLARKDKAIA